MVSAFLEQVLYVKFLSGGYEEGEKFFVSILFSHNNQLKRISIPKRHILGWQTLLTF